MAIKLVAEVMDWAPAGLTHREHKVLIILAENARLATRQIWDSVVSAKMLRRAQLTERQMYEVIDALLAKTCLVKTVWGGRNHQAKYAIAHLAVPRPAEARYAAYLSRLSPAERQFVTYADWWSAHSQPAENPHTENHGQHAGFPETEKPSSACGKPAPRLPTTTCRSENAGLRPRVKTTPPQPGNPPGHDGPVKQADDAQHIPATVQLQSQATGGNARDRQAAEADDDPWAPD